MNGIFDAKHIDFLPELYENTYFNYILIPKNLKIQITYQDALSLTGFRKE